MFEIESTWGGACDATNKLLRDLLGEKIASRTEPSNQDSNCDETAGSRANSKKRKRGKKKKKSHNSSIGITDTTNSNDSHISDSAHAKNKLQTNFKHKKLKKEEDSFKAEENEKNDNVTFNSITEKTLSDAPVNSLQKRLLSSLESSRFRYINEQVIW